MTNDSSNLKDKKFPVLVTGYITDKKKFTLFRLLQWQPDEIRVAIISNDATCAAKWRALSPSDVTLYAHNESSKSSWQNFDAVF